MHEIPVLFAFVLVSNPLSMVVLLASAGIYGEMRSVTYPKSHNATYIKYFKNLRRATTSIALCSNFFTICAMLLGAKPAQVVHLAIMATPYYAPLLLKI